MCSLEAMRLQTVVWLKTLQLELPGSWVLFLVLCSEQNTVFHKLDPLLPSGEEMEKYRLSLVPFFLFGATAPSGPWPPHSRGLYTTHNDAPQSVGLLWASDQIVAETST